MSLHPKLSTAKMALCISQPFFAHLAMHLRYVEDETIPTACTNGEVFRYSPAFLDTLSPPQAVFLMCHEVLHCALSHITRRHGRHPEAWNIAADFAVNDILHKSKFTFPDGEAITLADLTKGTPKTGYLLDPSLSHMATEEIYAKLPSSESLKGFGVSFGDFEDPSNGEEGDPQSTNGEMEAKWRVALSQAATMAKQQDRLPSHLSKLVEETLHPKLPWPMLLRQFIRDLTTSDYSWLRPNKTLLVLADILMPSLKSDACGPLVVAVDTSGSIACDPILLAEFVAELNAILDEVKPSVLTVLDIDAKVHAVHEYLPGDTVRNEWIGCGGTDFRPAFTYVAKHNLQPACLIYLTDMYGTFPDTDPGYPVLWISYSPEDKAPFGTVITTGK